MTTTNYPYETMIEVAFRDIDAMGHVNNAVFFSYLEFARVKYLARLLAGTPLERESLLDLPVILVEAACSYHSPALLSEHLTIGAGLSRFGNKSFDMVYRILGEDGRLVARGKTVQVMYDYATGHAFPIPEAFKTRVHSYQNGWSPD